MTEPEPFVFKIDEVTLVMATFVEVAFASVVFPVTPKVPATERLPEASIVVVAVPPKYAVREESIVDDAWAKSAVPVKTGEPEKTKKPEPVSSSMSAASSDDASMSFSIKMFDTPVTVSSSARVSIEVVESLLLKMVKSADERKPFVESDAAWPLV